MRLLAIGSHALLIIALTSVGARGQTIVNWQGGPTNNNWTTVSNWDSNALPTGAFDEVARIANGGTAIVNSNLASITPPDGPPGDLVVTNNSRLSITGSGAFVMNDSGPNVNATATFNNGGALALTGGSTSFTSKGLSFASGGVYAPTITSASHGLISVAGDLTLGGGTLKPTIGFSPSGPQSWILADATNIVGSVNLDSSAAGLSAGRKLSTSVVNGGVNGKQLRLDLKHVLSLNVNADTGAVTMSSPTGTAIAMTGYGVSSAGGQLTPVGWTTITSQVGGGWGVAGMPSANHLDELGGPVPPGNTTQASLTVNATPRTLGSVFNSNLPFGVAPDLKLEYTNTADEILQADVQLSGLNAINSLLLTVDPSSGQARLTNSSKTTIKLYGYSILSEHGSLKPAPGGWNSLDDQNVTGVEEANASPNHLSELIPLVADSLTLTPGQFYSLGSLFNTASDRDLSLEFAYTAPLEGDFNGSGTVDAADYVLWRKSIGTPTAYNLWKTNFGKSSSSGLPTVATGVVKYQPIAGSGGSAPVPEPATLVLVIGAIAAIGFCRTKRIEGTRHRTTNGFSL